MRTMLTLAVLSAIILLSSCTKNEDEPIPTVAIKPVAELKSTEILYGTKLKFTASVQNTDPNQVSWILNDKVVGKGVNFEFNALKVGENSIVLSATNYRTTTVAQLKLTVYGNYRRGTFVLNEGNMTSENGFLTYISPAGTVEDSIYYKVNKAPIGNVAQDLFIADGNMYIISQNGNSMGGNMLTVANAETLVKVAGYNSELSEKLSWPTHVAVSGRDSVYIRDNKGVYLFVTSSKSLSFIEGTEGALKNRMAVAGGKVFVPGSNAVLVLKSGKLVKSISMPGAVSGVLKSKDGNIWVSCTSTPAQIIKLNASNYEKIAANTLGDAGVGAGWGATPGISAKGDTLYFSNASFKIYRHIFSQNKTDFMVNVKDHVANAGIVYNNLAVSPKTGEVFFTTIKGYGRDYRINDISVWTDNGTTMALKNSYQNHTQFPAGIFFTDNF